MAGITEPLEDVLRREEVMPEIAKPVVVAAEVVALVAVKACKVEEARDKNPPVKVEAVEVVAKINPTIGEDVAPSAEEDVQ